MTGLVGAVFAAAGIASYSTGLLTAPVGSVPPVSSFRATGYAEDVWYRYSAFEVGRVRRAVDLLELANRDVCVNLRGSQIGVPQHRLNEPDVRAALEHQCGRRVAK